MYAVIEIEESAGGIPRSCRFWTKREDALESAVALVLECEDCRVTEEIIRDHLDAYGYETVGDWTVWMICAEQKVGGEKEWAMRESRTLRLRLFDLANTFGGDETGDIAIMLHEACNLILRASVKWDDYKSARPLDNDVRIR